MASSDDIRVRVALAEDQVLLRTSLERLLKADGNLELTASVGSLEELVAAVEEDPPQVAMVDLYMPERVPSGFDAPRRLRRRCPQVRLVALSASVLPGDVKRALAEGFHGYSTKEVTPRLLAERVRLVAAGKRFVDPEVTHVLLDDAPSDLDATEIAILQALALGSSHGEVAAGANISPRHLRRRIARIEAKLGASSPMQAVAVAVALGIVNP